MWHRSSLSSFVIYTFNSAGTMTEAYEHRGYVDFPVDDDDRSFKYRVTANEFLEIWIEDTTTKAQWQSASLAVNDFVTTDMAIPRAQVMDYATHIVECLEADLETTQCTRALSIEAYSVDDARVLRVGFPFQLGSFTPMLEYSFTLASVDLEDASVLHARLREVELLIQTAVVPLRGQVDRLTRELVETKAELQHVKATNERLTRQPSEARSPNTESISDASTSAVQERVDHLTVQVDRDHTELLNLKAANADLAKQLDAANQRASQVIQSTKNMGKSLRKQIAETNQQAVTKFQTIVDTAMKNLQGRVDQLAAERKTESKAPVPRKETSNTRLTEVNKGLEERVDQLTTHVVEAKTDLQKVLATNEELTKQLALAYKRLHYRFKSVAVNYSILTPHVEAGNWYYRLSPLQSVEITLDTPLDVLSRAVLEKCRTGSPRVTRVSGGWLKFDAATTYPLEIVNDLQETPPDDATPAFEWLGDDFVSSALDVHMILCPDVDANAAKRRHRATTRAIVNCGMLEWNGRTKTCQVTSMFSMDVAMNEPIDSFIRAVDEASGKHTVPIRRFARKHHKWLEYERCQRITWDQCTSLPDIKAFNFVYEALGDDFMWDSTDIHVILCEVANLEALKERS